MVTQKLHIITPLSRFHNSPDMFRSIEQNDNPHLLVKWWVVPDPSIVTGLKERLQYFFHLNTISKAEIEVVIGDVTKATAGHAHRNKILNILELNDIYTNDWIMSLDDDNIIHPNLFNIFNEKVVDYSGIIVDQILNGGTKRLEAHPDNVKVTGIDTAQFIFKTSIVKGLRFKEDEYAADGLFIEALYNNNKDKFLFINEPLCYYNYLR